MDMSFQTLFNGLLSVVLSAGGFMILRMFRALDRLESQDKKLTDQVNQLRVALPTNYMTKAELNHAFDQVLKKLDGIETKLDRKADK